MNTHKDNTHINQLSKEQKNSIHNGMSPDELLKTISGEQIEILKRPDLKRILLNKGSFKSKYTIVSKFLESGREVNSCIILILLDLIESDINYLEKVMSLFGKYGISDPHKSVLVEIKYNFLLGHNQKAKLLIESIKDKEIVRRRGERETKTDMQSIYILVNHLSSSNKEEIIQGFSKGEKEIEDRIRKQIKKLEKNIVEKDVVRSQKGGVIEGHGKYSGVKL